MGLSSNKKNNIYPCKPQFYYIKEGFKGGGRVKITYVCFRDAKAVPLLWFFFSCEFVVTHVAFVLSFFVLHLSFLLCLRRAVLRNCGISWVYSHILCSAQNIDCGVLVKIASTML